jgi:hypothetical protein
MKRNNIRKDLVLLELIVIILGAWVVTEMSKIWVR